MFNSIFANGLLEGLSPMGIREAMSDQQLKMSLIGILLICSIDTANIC